MDLIKGLSVFSAKEIIPHLDEGYEQYFDDEYKLGNIASQSIYRLTKDQKKSGLVKISNLVYDHEVVTQNGNMTNLKYDIIFNIRDKDTGKKPFEIELVDGSKIVTPDYISCINNFRKIPRMRQNLMVDAYLCPNELRVKLAINGELIF